MVAKAGTRSTSPQIETDSWPTECQLTELLQMNLTLLTVPVIAFDHIWNE